MKKEYGRSMIEMLGVLAIIGVLSIGGLAGYTMAMNRHRANVVSDYVSRCVVIAQTMGDGMTVHTGACKKITGEAIPSAIPNSGDATLSVTADATTGKKDITVEVTVAPAVGEILDQKDSGHITVANTAGAVTFTYENAATGMAEKAVAAE